MHHCVYYAKNRVRVVSHYTVLTGFDHWLFTYYTVIHDLCTVPMLSILLYRLSFIRTLESREPQTNYCTMIAAKDNGKIVFFFRVHPINARGDEVGLFHLIIVGI